MQHIHGFEQRNHNRLKRNQHRRNDNRIRYPAVAALSSVKDICCNRRECNNSNDSSRRNDNIVHKKLEIFDFLDYIAVIFPCRPARQCNRIRYDFTKRFKGVHKHQKNRINIKAGCCNQYKNQQYFMQGTLFLYCHYKSTSLLLNILSTSCVSASTNMK